MMHQRDWSQCFACLIAVQPEAMSPLLWIYLGFSRFSGPLWRRPLRNRVAKGKENPLRIPEKLGVPAAPRPEGEVLWFHALSVGESLALVPLIEHALEERQSASVVLTTSTVTSITALKSARLPERVVHSMLLIDTRSATTAFLEHWKPSVAVFAELDFWPRLMFETHRRNIPMVLVNSRMSDKSFKSRRKLGGMMRDVLSMFDALLLQDDASRAKFEKLGAPSERIHVEGALKSVARPLPADQTSLNEMKAQIGDRPVWLAAATHPAEDGDVLAAHKLVLKQQPDSLLIVAPRYPDRADQLINEARAILSDVAVRSDGDAISSKTKVYVADTIGEMGLWYRLAPVSFIGHSLSADGGGGKNPYEAAALGSAIISGPEVSDFSETFEGLTENGAAVLATSAQSLSEQVMRLASFDERAIQIENASKVIAQNRGVLDRTWSAIGAVLN